MKIKKNYIHQLISYIFICLLIISLIIFSDEALEAARSGIKICADVIIPSLFVFFVLANLMVETGFSQKLGKLLQPLMKPLFHTGGAGASALILGFIGGYPIGPSTIVSLYENKSICKQEAEKLLYFCNNTGPAFIIGVIGTGIFKSATLGIALYLIHIISAVMVGIIFRGKKQNFDSTYKIASIRTQHSFGDAFSNSIKNASSSTLNICAIIIFFTVFISIITNSGILPKISQILASIFKIFGLNTSLTADIITGFIEMSSGVLGLSEENIVPAACCASFIVSWSGLSVHSQVISLISKTDLSAKPCVIGKVFHAIISCLLTYFVFSFNLISVPTISYTNVSKYDFLQTIKYVLYIGIMFSVLFWLIKVLKKNCGKRPRSGV